MPITLSRIIINNSSPYGFNSWWPLHKKDRNPIVRVFNKNNILFAEGNAIKYLCRHKQKGQKQDLLKAKHYIDMAIERDYADDAHLKPVPAGFTLKK